MEILKLQPAGKDYLWGGTRLREEYGKEIEMTPIAETWECSVHPDGMSVVGNGRFAGQTLAAVLEKHPEYLGTKMQETRQLPILVKFIDAKLDLSVQVHPDDVYAREHEGDNGKTEMWYVLDAEEGASLVYGFEHPVTEDIIRNAVEQGTLEKHLHKEKVHKGDCFFVPSGVVHGIGAGTLLAEIQESSNVTYRVYDYDRKDKNGNKRPLHIEKAVQIMHKEPVKALRQQRMIHYYPGYSKEHLCGCKYFDAERIQITGEFRFPVYEESFQVLLCTSGAAVIKTENDSVPVSLKKGDCLFLCAGLRDCAIIGKAEVLKVRC